MGTLRSKTNQSGQTINGILLGQPVILGADGQPPVIGTAIDNLYFCWDDSALPNGELIDGEVVPDVDVP